MNLHTEVDPALLNRVGEVAKTVTGISIRVARDNIANAPADELIDSQVFEVAAVREVNEVAILAGRT